MENRGEGKKDGGTERREKEVKGMRMSDYGKKQKRSGLTKVEGRNAKKQGSMQIGRLKGRYEKGSNGGRSENRSREENATRYQYVFFLSLG